MKKIITLSIFLGFLGMLFSQQTIGLQSGNFSVPYSASINPANTYSSKARMYFGLYATSLGYTTNALNYQLPFGPLTLMDKTINNTGNNLFKFNPNFLPLLSFKSAKGFALNENYGPSFFIRAHRKYGFGFGVKSVTIASIKGLNNVSAALLRYGLDTSTAGFKSYIGFNKPNGINRFGIDALSYQEWFASFGWAAYDNNEHFLKLGVNVKLNLGNGYTGLHGDGGSFTVNNNNQFITNGLNLKFAHTSDATASTIASNPFGLNFKEISGVGGGLDLGFTYENRQNKNRKTIHSPNIYCLDELDNTYNWKLGASITDLGFIVFNGTKTKISNSSATNNISQISNAINQNANNVGVDRFQKMDTGILSKLGGNTSSSLLITTPTALNMQLDVRVNKNVFVAANWTQNLLEKTTMGAKRSSYLAITPRYEKEWGEIGIPISLVQDYSRFNVGFYGRLGPLVLGTDNFMGLINLAANNSHSSANFYAALRFKINVCNFEERRSTHIYDTTYTNSDSTFWKDTIYIKDTIRIFKTDTLTKIQKDTILITKQINSTAKEKELKQKEDALKRQEEELKQKSELIRLREIEVIRKESTTGKGNDDNNNLNCCRDLQTEKGISNRLLKELQNSSVELKKSKEELVIFKDKNNVLLSEQVVNNRKLLQLENELVQSKNQIKLLKEQLILCDLKAKSNNPCEKQTKTIDSLLVLEKAKNINLQSEVAQLKKKQEEVILNCDKLKKDIEILNKTNEELTKKVADYDKVVSDIKGKQLELDNLKIQNNTTSEVQKKRIQALEIETEDLKKQLLTCAKCDEEKSKIKLLETEISNLKLKVIEKDAEIKNIQTELVIAKSKNTSTEELIKLKLALENEEKKVQDLNGTITNLKKLLATKEADLEFEQNKNIQLSKDLQTCKNSSQTSEEVLKLKKQLTETEEEIANQKATIKQLQTTVNTQNSKILELENKLANCDKTENCDTYLAQIKSLEDKNNTIQSDLVQANKRSSNLEIELEKITNLYAICQTNLNNANNNTEEEVLKNKINSLNETVKKLDVQIDNVQQNLDNCKANQQNQDNNNQNQTSLLNQQIDKLTKEKEELRFQLEKCKKLLEQGDQ